MKTAPNEECANIEFILIQNVVHCNEVFMFSDYFGYAIK